MALPNVLTSAAGLLGFRAPRSPKADDADEIRHLGAPGRVILAQLGVSIALGIGAYAWLLDDAHDDLRNEIAHVDTVCLVWTSSPSLLGPATPNGARPGAGACRVDRSESLPSEDAIGTESFDSTELARIRGLFEGLALTSDDDLGLDYNEPDSSRWKLLLDAIKGDATLRSYLRQNSENFKARRSTETIVSFARALASTSAARIGSSATTGCGPGEAPSLATAHANVLDAVLGAEPSYEFNFRRPRPIGDDYRRAAIGLVSGADAGTNDGAPTGTAQDCVSILDDVLEGAGFVRRFGLMLRGAQRISDGEVLQALLAAYGVAQQGGWAIEHEKGNELQSVRSQQHAAAQFLLALMSQVRAAPGVRDAQSGVTLLRGGEQLIMLCLAIWLLLMLVARTVRFNHAASDKREVFEAIANPAEAIANLSKWLEASDRSMTVSRYIASTAVRLAGRDRRRNDAGTLREVCEAEADALFNSAWRIRLGIALLPGIGFVGTVLGIMAALANVDAISRAPAGAQQAVEVTFVAGSLGLAFATTAIALIAGLILRIFVDWLVAREVRVVTDLEIHLAPLLDTSLAAENGKEAVAPGTE